MVAAEKMSAYLLQTHDGFREDGQLIFVKLFALAIFSCTSAFFRENLDRSRQNRQCLSLYGCIYIFRWWIFDALAIADRSVAQRVSNKLEFVINKV